MSPFCAKADLQGILKEYFKNQAINEKEVCQ